MSPTTASRITDIAADAPFRVPASPTDPELELTVVVPTFEEADNIGDLLVDIHTVLSATDIGFEVLVVDDDSPDGTAERAAEAAAGRPEIRVLRRRDENGLATAVIRGWQHARGRYLGVIDGDGQHSPSHLPALVEALRTRRADIAIASRHIEGGGVSNWSFWRRVLSRGAQTVGLFVLPNTVGRTTDPMSGYFVVRRDVIADTDLHPAGYKILLEVLGRGDVRRVEEVAYVFQERERGESKVSARQYASYLRHLVRLRVHQLRSRILSRYLAVASVGLVVDVAVFAWLFSGLDLGLTRSAFAAGEVAVLANALGHDLFTFRRIDRRTPVTRLRRVVAFQLLLALTLVIRVALTNGFVNWADVKPYPAYVAAIAVVSPLNYFLSSRILWRHRIP